MHGPPLVCRYALEVANAPAVVKRAVSVYEAPIPHRYLDADELMEIFKELGMNPTREDVDKMIADVDADGSGEIGFTEFLTMMQSQSSTTDVVKKILGTFDRLDLDPHSILTRLEMSQIIQTMAEKLTDKETNALIDELEVNEDGDVTFDQLIYHMFSDKDQASNF